MYNENENHEWKRQHYASAIFHARNIKELPVITIPKFVKPVLIIVLVAVLVFGILLLGYKHNQSLALLGAGVSPFAEQTVISHIVSPATGLSESVSIRTETFDGTPIVVRLKLHDNGIWAVAETKILNSD